MVILLSSFSPSHDCHFSPANVASKVKKEAQKIQADAFKQHQPRKDPGRAPTGNNGSESPLDISLDQSDDAEPQGNNSFPLDHCHFKGTSRDSLFRI